MRLPDTMTRNTPAAGPVGRPAKRLWRRWVTLATGVLMAGTVAACGTPAEDESASSEDPSAVRFVYVPSTAWLPAIVASAQGFFEDNGLDVKPTVVQQSAMAAIGQQFDIGQATGSDFVQAVNGGLDQVVLSTVAQETEETAALMVQEGSDIKSVEDLAGKRVGIPSRTSGLAQSLLFLLAEAGVDASDVTLQEVPFPTMTDQLTAGRVDAIAAVEPFASQAEAAGATRLFNPLMRAGKAIGAGTPITMFAASSREWSESHPEQVEAWRRSLEQAVKFIETNEQAARDDLQAATGLPAEIADKAPLYDYPAKAASSEQVSLWVKVLERSGTLKKDSGLDATKMVAP